MQTFVVDSILFTFYIHCLSELNDYSIDEPTYPYKYLLAYDV